MKYTIAMMIPAKMIKLVAFRKKKSESTSEAYVDLASGRTNSLNQFM
jgi:hypothetical protein